MEELLNNVKAVLDMAMEKLDSLNTRVDGLENILYNEILMPVKQRYEELDYNDRLNTFSETYKDKFEPYNEATKVVEGNDFDLTKKAFDDYEASDKAIPEAEYVDAVVESVSSQLEQIKAALNNEGIPAENVETTTTEEGTEIVATDAEGNVVADEKQIEQIMNNEETSVEEPIIADEEEEESNADELAAFENELNADKDKMEK